VDIMWKKFTISRQCYCSLNGVCYSEHYMEDTSQLVDLVLQLDWNVLPSTLYGRYFTVSGECYCSLN